MGIYSESRDTDIIGWKKVLVPRYSICIDGCDTEECITVIAKLIIPKEAQVVFGDTKCRASQAIVDGFYPINFREISPSPDEELKILWACSARDRETIYIPGQTVIPDWFDPDQVVTCSHGIHFFRLYQEACDYVI